MHSKSTGTFIYLFEDLILRILLICREEKSFERDGFLGLVNRELIINLNSGISSDLTL